MLSRSAILFLGALSLLSSATGAWALQAGGVEVGDLQTGSVVGQPFKELEVDAELFAWLKWAASRPGIHRRPSSTSKSVPAVRSC